MNEKLEELFGNHFNGLHYEDITKEMMFDFAVDYANIKVEAEKKAKLLSFFEHIQREYKIEADVTFGEVLKSFEQKKNDCLNIGDINLH